MAKLREVSGKVGISIEVNGAWYRPEFGAVIDLEESDTPDKRKAIVKKLFEFLMDGLNEQIEEIVSTSTSNPAPTPQRGQRRS